VTREAPHTPGDGGLTYVARYTTMQRINHWVTAALFTMLTLSGLSLFHPSLFFLTGLFGGGPSTRAIHPWFGVVLFLSFLMLFFRFWSLNLPNRDDVEWSKRIGDVVSNRHDRLPELGKYNAGQKMVFWGQSILITCMFLSGLVIWDQYFGLYTGIEPKRIALLVHSLAALVAILIIFVHVYAGIWIKGTGRAMMRGNVTGGWAYRHHRKWLRKEAAEHGIESEAEIYAAHHPAPAVKAPPAE
jgi:formate dehydrogenase subunit gamma